MALRTNDPVRDAERYFSRLDQRPVIGKCAICGCDIRGKDDYYDSDEMFLFDNGEAVCDECLLAYCREHFRV